MASGWAPSSKENTNFTRLCRLLIDGGTRALKHVFDTIHPPSSLHGVLVTPSVHSTLQRLLHKRVLHKSQWDKLYPASTPVTSSGFDITLLFLLLRNICSLKPPSTGWDKPALASDLSREADLARIKLYRNELYGHITDTSIKDSDFVNQWKEIEGVLLRLAPHLRPRIEMLKVESMDPEDQRYFIECLEEWEQNEKKLKELLKEREERVLKKVDESQRRTVEKLDELQQLMTDKLDVVGSILRNNDNDLQTKDVELSASQQLKSSVKASTELQSKLVHSTIASAKTDDIFTNLTIQHGRKHLKHTFSKQESACRTDQLESYIKLSSTPVKHIQDIFIGKEIKKPRSIQLTGKPGIGKTLFTEKLIRDWALDNLFSMEAKSKAPHFKFAFLLTFRQLNLLGDEQLNLKELLNKCPLIDERSRINDKTIAYIVQHPEEVLLILDGYDEYSHRGEMTGDSELKYDNDLQIKMPVHALCAKLIKGKILKDSVIMLSSRHGVADELRGIPFDEYVEITGFSSQQVTEFIEKYFREDEVTKSVVDKYIQNNPNLVSLCHVPVMCYLMCGCMEWHREAKPSEDLSTTTDFYSEIIKVFQEKHDKSSQNTSAETARPSESNPTKRFTLMNTFRLTSNSEKSEKPSSPREVKLLKIAEFAAKLLQEKQYVFDEEDMKKAKLSEQEIANLKASGLLHCGPGERKSPSLINHSFQFLHLTVQEYLAALWFVEMNIIPNKQTSGMVLQFMSGLLAREQNSHKMMTKMFSCAFIFQRNAFDTRLMWVRCLFEYGDKELAETFVKNHFYQPCADGWIGFARITDMDCQAISFLLDVASSLNNKQHLVTYTRLDIATFSSLTTAGLNTILQSLTHSFCHITQIFFECKLNDECVESIVHFLPETKIAVLNLYGNAITDKGVNSLCDFNVNTPKLTTLILTFNRISDKGAESLCRAIEHPDSMLALVDLSYNNITDGCREFVRRRVKTHKPDVNLIM